MENNRILVLLSKYNAICTTACTTASLSLEMYEEVLKIADETSAQLDRILTGYNTGVEAVQDVTNNNNSVPTEGATSTRATDLRFSFTEVLQNFESQGSNTPLL